MNKQNYLMKNITTDTPLESPLWNIRQVLKDMASNLDNGYVNGSISRDQEIDNVECQIDILVEQIFDKLEEEEDDRLAELEATIKEYLTYNGGLEPFEVQVGSMHKNKYIKVGKITQFGQLEHIITATGKTTKEMFDKAFEFFKVEG